MGRASKTNVIGRALTALAGVLARFGGSASSSPPKAKPWLLTGAKAKAKSRCQSPRLSRAPDEEIQERYDMETYDLFMDVFD